LSLAKVNTAVAMRLPALSALRFPGRDVLRLSGRPQLALTAAPVAPCLSVVPARTKFHSTIKQLSQPPPPPKVSPDFIKQNFAPFQLPRVQDPAGEIPYSVDRFVPDGLTPLPVPPYVTNPYVLLQLKKFYSLNRIQPPQWGVYPVWHPKAVRCGAIARKVGMTQIWNEHGVIVPVTVLQVCGRMSRL
jgi:hypothetical protein